MIMSPPLYLQYPGGGVSFAFHRMQSSPTSLHSFHPDVRFRCHRSGGGVDERFLLLFPALICWLISYLADKPSWLPAFASRGHHHTPRLRLSPRIHQPDILLIHHSDDLYARDLSELLPSVNCELGVFL